MAYAVNFYTGNDNEAWKQRYWADLILFGLAAVIVI
jgi:hypothetical protein